MSYSPARIEEIAKPETSEAEAALNSNVDSPAPSWFADDNNIDGSDHLAQRYRDRIAKQEAQRKAETELMENYRRKLDARFKAAKALYDKPGNDNPPEVKLQTRRPTLPLSEIVGRGQRHASENAAIADKSQTTPPNHSWRTYITWAVLAVVSGSAIGFGFAHRDRLVLLSQDGMNQAKATLASMSSTTPDTPARVTSGSSVIMKKQINMASLSVNDAAGTLNSMIPLALTARPSSLEQPVDILISGLPASAYLTAGHQVEEGSWRVKAPDMADLKLVVPQSVSPKISLDVAAVEQGTSNLAAPMQKLSVEFSDVKIVPASAPPDAQGSNITVQTAPTNSKEANTAVQPIPQPVGTDLLSRADGLMNQGDVISARQYYMQAANAGSPRGILGVARTYDPKVFAEMKIEGLLPDAVKAAEWYKKAQAAGLKITN